MKKFFSVFLCMILVFSVVSIGASAEETKQFKNVILLIGDGMGFNSIAKAKAETGNHIYMEDFPYQGQSKTRSLSNSVTDSAAGGTALATGKRTNNGNIATLSWGVDDYGVKFMDYKTMCELAKEKGMKAGVLTSDSNTGATPASFTAHVEDRGMGEKISNQQLKADFDLIWAGKSGFITESNASENGYAYIDSVDDAQNLEEGTKSFGVFSGMMYKNDGTEDNAPLSVLTTEALRVLDNDKGFFLMIEGAHIDKHSHSNNGEEMVKALCEFDIAVKNVLDFAKADGNTLVVITADHETGGIKLDEKSNSYVYTKTGHSGANVPVFVYGSDQLVKDNAAVKNLEIGQFLASSIGGELPVTTSNPDAVKDFFIFLKDLIFGFFTGEFF